MTVLVVRVGNSHQSVSRLPFSAQEVPQKTVPPAPPPPGAGFSGSQGSLSIEMGSKLLGVSSHPSLIPALISLHGAVSGLPAGGHMAGLPWPSRNSQHCPVQLIVTR